MSKINKRPPPPTHTHTHSVYQAPKSRSRYNQTGKKDTVHFIKWHYSTNYLLLYKEFHPTSSYNLARQVRRQHPVTIKAAFYCIFSAGSIISHLCLWYVSELKVWSHFPPLIVLRLRTQGVVVLQKQKGFSFLRVAWFRAFRVFLRSSEADGGYEINIFMEGSSWSIVSIKLKNKSKINVMNICSSKNKSSSFEKPNIIQGDSTKW